MTPADTIPVEREDGDAMRRGLPGRLLSWVGYLVVAVLFGAVVGMAGFYLRLASGPLSLAAYNARLAEELAARIGPGWKVRIGAADLDLVDGAPAVLASAMEVRNPDGELIVQAPRAVVSVDLGALVTGTVAPREIELKDLRLRILMADDGTMSFSASDEAKPAPVPTLRAGGPATATPSLASMLTEALDPLLRVTQLFAGLERVSIADARLALIGPNGGERLVFSDVDATYDNVGTGDRRVDISLDGGRGRWLIGGHLLERNGRRVAELRADDVPLADLAGLRGVSGELTQSRIKLSASVTAAMDGPKIVALEGALGASPGRLEWAGRPPIDFERAEARLRWDEARGTLDVTEIAVDSGATQVRLTGDVQPAEAGGWRLRLGGRDLPVSGMMVNDRPFRLDSVQLQALLGDEALTVERFVAKGNALDVSLSASSRMGADGRDLKLSLDVGPSDLRRLVRLWPTVVSPRLRAYLAENMTAGRVDAVSIRTNLDANQLRRALADQPLPDGVVDGRFKFSDARLVVGSDMPPLEKLGAEGRINGNRVTFSASSAAMTMPDGRRLLFADGSYDQADYDLPTTVAKIAFRVFGPADAFASAMRSPTLLAAGAPEIDPGTIRGRGDMRVRLTLPLKAMPDRLAAIPFGLTGTLSELAVDKIAGKEKLEAGNLNLSLEGGALAVKGEARLSGVPATIDFQARDGKPGEAVVQLTLDEAARSRRGLPGAPQLAGPVPVKVTTILGPKVQTRVEADLSRASLDNLVPGWTKAAGRPGRVSFLLGEGETPDLRDLVVDSGTTQIKGQVALSSASGIERADLPQFRLSTGDDMRVQLDRSGGAYRIAVKGNVGDARPFMKWAGGAGDKKGGGKDMPDVDLDLAVNILTGHNDEALTGANAKLSARNGAIRSLQFGGRFRSAAVDVRMSRPDSGNPLLSIKSADAGATLRFVDLYKRAVGGKLTLDARIGDGSQDGILTVDDFRLRGEPALRQLVTEAVPPPTSGQDERGGTAERINPDEVQFTKLTADFRRSATRIDFRDVVMWGQQVGFTVSGMMDHGRDAMDITGTFVPAYALNNAFSQVPLVGLLLGGGRNEGLFAIDFRVSGPVSAPTFSVNPLSAMAPGILRKFIGAIMPPGGAEPPQATGAVAPRGR